MEGLATRSVRRDGGALEALARFENSMAGISIKTELEARNEEGGVSESGRCLDIDIMRGSNAPEAARRPVRSKTCCEVDARESLKSPQVGYGLRWEVSSATGNNFARGARRLQTEAGIYGVLLRDKMQFGCKKAECNGRGIPRAYPVVLLR